MNIELEFNYVDDKKEHFVGMSRAYVIDNYGAHVCIGHLLTTMILVSGQYFEDAQVPLLESFRVLLLFSKVGNTFA